MKSKFENKMLLLAWCCEFKNFSSETKPLFGAGIIWIQNQSFLAFLHSLLLTPFKRDKACDSSPFASTQNLKAADERCYPAGHVLTFFPDCLQ